MIQNPAISSLAAEYEISLEVFYECAANACRKIYGILEVDSIGTESIRAFIIGENGKLARKNIKLTKAGMLRVAKGILHEIDHFIQADRKRLEMNSYRAALDLLEADILTISKMEVNFRVISTRQASSKERTKDSSVLLFVIVRASRFLSPAELNYFKMKSASLKKGIRFALD